ncbi:hypothetical protein Cni_G09852 [Canna indica]|uniref:Uncharacterized protein n=1 Tax=Canna indica TaxID=4628 RepID=A0AAQ3Q9S0_9LILI|nr:hypothetical protein Cni_G09852 [Canna indica]
MQAVQESAPEELEGYSTGVQEIQAKISLLFLPIVLERKYGSSGSKCRFDSCVKGRNERLLAR